jgi:hypothetical protein
MLACLRKCSRGRSHNSYNEVRGMDQTALIDTIAKTPEYMTTAIGAVGAIGGALIAVVAGFLTAWMTNRHGRKLLARQLEADSRERQRERQVNLRRDVYLPAADAVVSASAVMGKLAGGDPEASQQSIAALQAFGATITRVQMVATPETVRHAAEYHRAVLATMNFLQRQNHALTLLRSDIDLAHDSRESHFAERARFVEMMKAYNIEEKRDPARFERMQQHAAFAEELRAEAHSAWLRGVHAFETARVETIRGFIDPLTELARLQVPLLAAIRRELETGEESHALIAEEAEKTAVIGLEGITGQVPLVEAGIERFRAAIAEDEKRRGEQQAVGH